MSMNVFEDIYKKNVWTYGSGHGSLPKVTKGYRKFLRKFIENHDIKSVVDFGCGDWQFSQFINWDGVDYLGYDVVKNLITTNQNIYGKENISFQITPKNWKDLESADLLIVKDVLQHLSNKEVKKFIEDIKDKYRYVLITNGTNPKEKINEEISTGGYRPLDIRKDPFNFRAKKVYSFDGPRNKIKKLSFKPSWSKDVLLIDGQ